MITEIIQDAEHRMDQAVTHTSMELAKIRTGRANPDILASIQIDYYGTPTPLNQVANLSIPEAKLLAVQPYEKHLIKDIEKAIINSNLGLTPNNNGIHILIPIPSLSEERRKELIRFANSLTEEGRVAARNVRRDAIHHLKALEGQSEDEIKRVEKEIQEMTDKHIEHLGNLFSEKEKEIIEN